MVAAFCVFCQEETPEACRVVTEGCACKWYMCPAHTQDHLAASGACVMCKGAVRVAATRELSAAALAWAVLSVFCATSVALFVGATPGQPFVLVVLVCMYPFYLRSPRVFPVRNLYFLFWFPVLYTDNAAPLLAACMLVNPLIGPPVIRWVVLREQIMYMPHRKLVAVAALIWLDFGRAHSTAATWGVLACMASEFAHDVYICTAGTVRRDMVLRRAEKVGEDIVDGDGDASHVR